MQVRAHAFLAVLSAVACAEASAPMPVPLVRDSAGIRIVDNAGAARPAVRLPAEPMVTIGVVSGETAYQLNGVVGATRMDDGRVVVANGGTRELRFFTPDGTHLRTVGGRGAGPGEFRWLRRLARLPGDTLVATDLSPGRQLRFDANGEYLSMANFAIRGNEVPTILTDASILVPVYESGSFGGEFELFAVGRRTPDADGVFRPRFELTRVHRDSIAVDTIGRFVGEGLYKVDLPGSFGMVWYLPFGRRTLYAASGERIWIMHTSRAELAVYDLDGTLRTLVRFPSVAVPLADGDRAAFRTSVEPRINPNRRADFERWFAEVPYPETKALATALVPGPDGAMWLQRSQPFASPSDAWSVFSADGSWQGEVFLPPGTEPLEIGRDYLLALWRDELDVEFVRVYRIEGV